MALNENNVALARWRGLVLELVHSAFRKRLPAYDLVMMTDLMRSMGQDVGENDVIFILRQLKDLGCVVFEEERKRATNELNIREVRVTPKGCRLVEGFDRDDAVMIRL